MQRAVSRLAAIGAVAALFLTAVAVNAREETPVANLGDLTAAEEVTAAETEGRAGAIDEGQGLLSAAAITLEGSIAAAQAAAPGEVGEIDLQVTDEGIVFVVDIGSNEVMVDAETGLVLSVVAED